MLPRDLGGSDEGSVLEKIKIASGWCIEERRKRAKITQDRLAKDVGVTVRWLREIEAGNPKASIEDHLRCASALGLTAGYLLILVMFMEREMTFPRELLLDDLTQIEDRCVACIAEFSVASLARRLRFPTSTTTSLPG
jgi:transcriptional regulator with XRE-family HTH domain